MKFKLEELKKAINMMKKKHNIKNIELAQIMGLNYSHIFRVLNAKSPPRKKIYYWST